MAKHMNMVGEHCLVGDLPRRRWLLQYCWTALQQVEANQNISQINYVW